MLTNFKIPQSINSSVLSFFFQPNSFLPFPSKVGTTAMPPIPKQPPRHGFVDDLKKIKDTHKPDGIEYDVRPLLHVVEDIMHRATPIIPGTALAATQAQLEAMDERANEMLEFLAYPINRIAYEINFECSRPGSNKFATTVALFETLSSYMWDAKVVIALAAFAVNCGEFWLVARPDPTDPLAKSVTLLKQFPDVLKSANSLKPKFEDLTTLIKTMLDVTKCIVEFKELPSQYIIKTEPDIPNAVCWTIKSIVACTSQIMNLIGVGQEYKASTTEPWDLTSKAWELSKLAHEGSDLKNQLALRYQRIDEKRQIEAYETLVRLFKTPDSNNMKILQALIYAEEDQLPLWDGHTKKRVSLDVLRWKNVLLFISDLDLSHDQDLFMLDQVYSQQHPARPESRFEIVWLPIVDRSTPWTKAKQKQFESIQAQMLWYSVHRPSLVAVIKIIKYIREVWHFNKKPVLVALDPQGRVVNTNAIHMMWIWGNLAFPFTTAIENGLWKGETWRIELLADSIEPLIFTWISEGKYICLYGGEDMEWIRKFTTTAKAVAKVAGIPLEMLYVGKSNPREKVRKNNTTIVAENLSHVLPDITLICFFWVRLESMLYSKTQHGKSVENDPIMQEIMTMLSFDGSEQGWAVISRGSAEMAKAKGDTILTSLTQFEKWRQRAEREGFVPALNADLHGLHTPHHCNRLILPGTTGTIPKRVVCAECGRPMELFIIYRCSTD